MTYLHLKADGTSETVTPKDGKKFSLEELQGFVGGYIERVRLLHGAMLWVNEEGKLNGLPINREATKLYHEAQPRTFDMIVGDALLCTPKPREKKEGRT